MSNQVNFDDGYVSGSITNPNIINSLEGGIPPTPSGSPYTYFGENWQSIAGLTGANGIVSTNLQSLTYPTTGAQFFKSIQNTMSQYTIQNTISGILNLFQNVTYLKNGVPVTAAGANITADEILDALNTATQNTLINNTHYQSFQTLTDLIASNYANASTNWGSLNTSTTLFDNMGSELTNPIGPVYRIMQAAMNSVALNHPSLFPTGTNVFGTLTAKNPDSSTISISDLLFQGNISQGGHVIGINGDINGFSYRVIAIQLLNTYNNAYQTGTFPNFQFLTLSNFFGQYNVNNPFPTTLDALLVAFQDYINKPTVGAKFSTSLLFPDGTTIPSQYSLGTYAGNVGLTLGSYTQVDTSLLESLFQTAYTNITQDNSATGLNNAYSAFAKTYSFNSDGTVGKIFTPLNFSSIDIGTNDIPSDPNAAIAQFFNSWLRFLAPVQLAPTDPQSIYLEVFNSFNPNATQADFTAAYNAFVTEQKNANYSATGVSYFIPGQSLRAFFLEQQDAFQHSPNAGLGVSPFLSAFGQDTHSEKALILMRILVLLQGIIGTLQQLEAAQAQQLHFLANYQNVYTNIQGQWSIFTKSGQAKLSSDTTGDVSSRTEINSQINGQFSQNIQAYRNIVSDQAKQVQTNLNQTNDAASQQGDTATSILQELSSLLQSIFR